jgi:hypothetical protein
MAHHLDSPVARNDTRLKITDHYVFDGEGATVFVMNVRTPPATGSHRDAFHPAARYELKIHLDNHDREALTYRWIFLPAHGHEQHYRVERLTAAEAGGAGVGGTVIAQGRTEQDLATRELGKAWAGRAVESFYLDLRQLHDINGLVQRGEAVDLGRWVRNVAEDSFVGSMVQSIVLCVPLGADGLSTGRQIATWATTELATEEGGWRQVNRAGLPMIWSIFRPAGDSMSSRHRTSHPAKDPADYGPAISGLVASTVERLGTSDRPDAYADSVVERIVPDLLHYVVGSPAVLGFARFNGRRLADNAAEVMFSLATNSAVTTGLRAADVRRSQEAFPFVIPVAEQPSELARGS